MDEIIIQPALHQGMGIFTLLVSLLATALAWAGYRRGVLGRPAAIAFVALQVALFIQALIGIKLLDQGMGVMQKFVHYLGGIGALGLMVMFYWISYRDEKARVRWAAGLSTAALAFVALSLFVGDFYVRSLQG